MRGFKYHTVFEIARSVKAYLKLEVGVTRGESPQPESQSTVPGPVSVPVSSELQTLESFSGSASDWQKTRQENAKLRSKLEALTQRGKIGGVRPESIVWIFGTARTGSTWFSSMMGDLAGYAVWDEPLVGDLFGHLYYIRGTNHIDKRGDDFILGRSHKESWLNSIRSFVLSEATERFPKLSENDYLVVKEPNGSIGAPLLMEALPESRMALLIRDPRDMVASLLEAHQEGSWLYEWRRDGDQKQEALPSKNPNAFVESRAKNYLRNAGRAKEAYDAHEGHKVLVKYEDLRADALSTMKHVYSSLGIPVDGKELARVVEEHSWENIPEEEKGVGKFNRKATPGSWREDLTPEQVKIVEKITAPLLTEFYPA